MTEFNVVLPVTFDPADYLRTPELKKRLDDARYFVGLILVKLARGQVDARGLVRLHAKHLKTIMYQVTYSKVIQALIEGDVVERFSYLPGSHSFGFRLSNRFSLDRHVGVSLMDRRLKRRLKEFRTSAAAEVEAKLKPVHRELARRQTKLEILGSEGRRILDGLPAKSNPFDIQGILISDIERKDFRCSVGKYGRVSNNISSMSRHVRTTLRMSGQQLASVDLSCAQPALLGKIMASTPSSRYDSSFQVCPDFRFYLGSVQEGRIYDLIEERLRSTGITRDQIKKQFMRDVLAKRGNYHSSVEQVFVELFPTVHRFIRSINSSDHSNLIRLLQREESKFVIETVAANFMARSRTGAIVTLHDCIFTTPDYISELIECFEQEFVDSGFRMQMKIAVPRLSP